MPCRLCLTQTSETAHDPPCPGVLIDAGLCHDIRYTTPRVPVHQGRKNCAATVRRTKREHACCEYKQVPPRTVIWITCTHSLIYIRHSDLRQITAKGPFTQRQNPSVLLLTRKQCLQPILRHHYVPPIWPLNSDAIIPSRRLLRIRLGTVANLPGV